MSNETRDRSQRAKNLRAWILRNEPLCRICKAAGRTRAAEVVDHITPISRSGAEHDPANLQALCVDCHKAKTAQEFGTRPTIGADGWPVERVGQPAPRATGSTSVGPGDLDAPGRLTIK